MIIRIEQIDPTNPLSKKLWGFSVSTLLGDTRIRVRLSEFSAQHKPSTRHRKWTTFARWDAHRERNSIGKPTVPPVVQDDLLRQIHNRILLDLN